jgi:hypothetical protein
MTLDELRRQLDVLAAARADVGTLPVVAEYLSLSSLGVNVWSRSEVIAADIQESQHDATKIVVVLLASQTLSDL